MFNPPYVPTPDEEVERGGIAAAWAGGERGRRVTDRLLPLAPALLSPRGEMFMVAVHENDPPGELGAGERPAQLPVSGANTSTGDNMFLSGTVGLAQTRTRVLLVDIARRAAGWQLCALALRCSTAPAPAHTHTLTALQRSCG